MADEAQGNRTRASWTKLFTAFRVALDLKKLLLAAAGIVVTALGWWACAAVFYTSNRPEWVDYKETEDKKAAWSRFKRDRERWNLLHEMAGPTPTPETAKKTDAADVANSLEVFDELNRIKTIHLRSREPVVLKLDENTVLAGGRTLVVHKDDVASLVKHTGEKLVLSQVVIVDEAKQLVGIAGVPVRIDSDLKTLKAALVDLRSLDHMRAEADRLAPDDKKIAVSALDIYETKLVHPSIRPVGKLRTWPWTEERGPNQYLLAEGLLRKDAEGHRTVPWETGQFFSWLVSNQLPVLIEPLMKFLAPIGYFFNSAGDGLRNRLYLILVILWTVATWAFFGGAICRIAAVQIARNEKIGLRESLRFAREKFLNLFTAPILPLLFIGVLTVFLIFIAWLIGFTFQFGDIFLAGPLFPIVLVLGLIMAVVLIGLIGWPLMNPTIAVEGSDNFDALSRSYSYVYQSIWQYLWYWTVALIYGAALIFFVGLVGSLVIYMGKFGMSQAPGLQSSDPARDRDPAYLFTYAPTSFGWRDLLIKDNPHIDPKTVVTPSGLQVQRYDFTENYKKELSITNRIAAAFVGLWVGLFFLLIVGFGYSFFWTSSTIIYFLIRKHVDDTELDEVYFDDGELEAPAPPSVVTAPMPAPASQKPNTLSLNVVDPGAPPPPPPPPPPPHTPAPHVPAPTPMASPAVIAPAPSPAPPTDEGAPPPPM